MEGAPSRGHDRPDLARVGGATNNPSGPSRSASCPFEFSGSCESAGYSRPVPGAWNRDRLSRRGRRIIVGGRLCKCQGGPSTAGRDRDGTMGSGFWPVAEPGLLCWCMVRDALTAPSHWHRRPASLRAADLADRWARRRRSAAKHGTVRLGMRRSASRDGFMHPVGANRAFGPLGEGPAAQQDSARTIGGNSGRVEVPRREPGGKKTLVTFFGGLPAPPAHRSAVENGSTRASSGTAHPRGALRWRYGESIWVMLVAIGLAGRPSGDMLLLGFQQKTGRAAVR